MGQVMQRMRLSILGGLVDNSVAVNTFKIALVFLFCYTIFDYALYTYLYPYDQIEEPEYAYIVGWVKYAGGLIYGLWFLLAKARSRRNIRETYSIPEEQCVGCEDVVVSAFCSCCTGKFHHEHSKLCSFFKTRVLTLFCDVVFRNLYS